MILQISLGPGPPDTESSKDVEKLRKLQKQEGWTSTGKPESFGCFAFRPCRKPECVNQTSLDVSLYIVHLGANPSRSPQGEAVLAAESPVLPVVEATPAPPKRRKLTTFKAVAQLSHCPEPSEAVVRSRKALMLRKNKLKYTRLHQRSQPVPREDAMQFGPLHHKVWAWKRSKAATWENCTKVEGWAGKGKEPHCPRRLLLLVVVVGGGGGGTG